MFEANEYYANPEIFFAAGYTACFNRVLNLIIKKG